MIKRKRYFRRAAAFVLLLAGLFPAGGQGQDILPPDSTLNFAVDVAQFRINDTLTLAEIYFAVPRSHLQFLAQGDSLEAGFEIEIGVHREGRELVREKWLSRTFAGSENEVRDSQTLFSLARFQFRKGEYVLLTRVRDKNSDLYGEKAFPITIETFPADSLTISTLEFASEIKKDTAASVYSKNGYRVIPNPTALYGSGMPLLLFYAEIYNLSYPSEANYTTVCRVLDAAGVEVKRFGVKEKRIAGRSLVEISGFNVLSLQSGSYVLELEVRDQHNGASARRQKRFFVFRVQDQENLTAKKYDSNRSYFVDALHYYYKDKSEAALDEEFEAARWIATNKEIDIYSSLDLAGKRKFLANFWYEHDSDTTTVRNEFREDYLERVRYANSNFSGFKIGSKTDRGRILLMYGKPDEIERFPSTANQRSYEIWNYYELEGGVIFVFVDIRGWGEYQLVHSTVRKELNDPEWQRWLSVQPVQPISQ